MSPRAWIDPKPSDPWAVRYFCPFDYTTEPCFLATRCDSVEELRIPGRWVGQEYGYMLVRCPYGSCSGIVKVPYDRNYFISAWCPRCGRHLYLYTEDDFKILVEDDPFANCEGEKCEDAEVEKGHAQA